MVYYNFCPVHQTLRVTSAMEAALADHGWSWAELARLLDGRMLTKAVRFGV